MRCTTLQSSTQAARRVAEAVDVLAGILYISSKAALLEESQFSYSFEILFSSILTNVGMNAL